MSLVIMGFWNKLKFSFRHFLINFFQTTFLIDDNEALLIIMYFQGTLVFHEINI